MVFRFFFVLFYKEIIYVSFIERTLPLFIVYPGLTNETPLCIKMGTITENME